VTATAKILQPWRASGIVFMLLALAAQRATAQVVEGRVVARSSGQPLAGVVVALADSAGGDTARALTDAEGRFVVRAPGAGTYRVMARLVGWRPWSSPPIALAAGQTLQYRIENPLYPITLPEVRVEAVQRCRADSESGHRIARLWEETRLALAVLSWTEQEQELRVRWSRYDRRLHPRSLEVLEEELVAAEGLYAGSPFVSRPGNDLAEQGYVRRDSVGAWEFLAPDADALLSDAFVRDHCFHLLADPAASARRTRLPAGERYRRVRYRGDDLD
jgi:hypothetical protein